MEIKLCKVSDYSQVIELHKHIFNEDNKSFFNSLQSRDYYKTFVATHNNNVVAYCIISEIAGEAEVINIATKQEFRKQNIATKLLQYAIDNINARIVFLEVSSTNMSALRLYTKVGFNKYGKRKNYYGNSDAILMKLQKN